MRIGVHLGHERIALASIGDDGRLATAAVEGSPTDNAEQLELLGVGLDLLERDWEGTAAHAQVRRITFDVGTLLDAGMAGTRERPSAGAGTVPVMVRIAPRPPADRQHELRGSAPGLGQAHIHHLRGGHSAVGEELAPLDTDAAAALAGLISPGQRVVVTAVGSLANAQHELAVGKALLAGGRPAEVSYSHAFFSTSFAARERTAMLNSSLTDTTAPFATELAAFCRARYPQARPLVSTNDGGSTSLSRLSVSPVHSLASSAAAKIVGAAARLGHREGKLLVDDPADPLVGQLLGGLPIVGSRYSPTAVGVIASRGALNWSIPGASAAAWTGPRVQVEAPEALCAVGAACAPVTEWVNAMSTIKTHEEYTAALTTAENRATARLVSLGYAPSAVRTAEASAEATTFGHPNIVAIRVRAVVDGLPTHLATSPDPQTLASQEGA